MHSKSPSVMAFCPVCLGILPYSWQNTSRDMTCEQLHSKHKKGILHTKISPPETPGEIFKGFPIRLNFCQTLSPECAEGLAKSLCCFKLHNLSEKILQIFYTCILRISRCACICMSRLCQELKVFFFDCFQFCRDSNID